MVNGLDKSNEYNIDNCNSKQIILEDNASYFIANDNMSNEINHPNARDDLMSIKLYSNFLAVNTGTLLPEYSKGENIADSGCLIREK